MEHDHHQSQDIYSPRQKYELTDQLGQLQVAQQENVLFEQGDNPFSFYNQINKRESLSSQDEAPQEQQLTHTLPAHLQLNSTNSQYKSIEVTQNLINKAPIKLAQSPKANTANTKIQNISSPKANIKLLKQSEFDMSTIGQGARQANNGSMKQVVNSSKLQSSPAVKASPAAQKKYEQQLKNDLQGLKKSMKGKQAKKKSKIFDSKQTSPKINFNKTYAPSSRTRYDNEEDVEMQQMRMLVKMAFQKKKANYQMLKEWDMKRAENMALHGKMIEMLQNQIDLRIKSSLQNFQNYQTFFKEKARQQQKYVSSPVINTRFALQNNSLSKNVYINCSVILNSLCDQNTNRCKKINQFIFLIRTNILKELTENHLNSSQKQLLKVREKISTLKSSLKKYNLQTEEKTIELANLFKEQSNNITNKCDKDFYRTQLSFLRNAIQQIEVQKKLGEYCLEYYHTAVQEELKRSCVIREAMMTYSQGLKQTYNIEIGIQIQQMSKNQELKLIEEYFSLEDMFDERTIELFKLKNHIKHDLTIEQFTKYINRFSYEPFDSRIILLKQFNVKYKGKEGEQGCYLVITVDNFLHLFFNCNRSIGNKPDITIKIGHKWLQIKALKDESVQIVKKQQKKSSMMSYFWDSKMDKVYRVKFNKKDNKEEFIDYITKLMVDYY